MRAFHEEIDGTPYDRRAFAMLIIYICGFGLSWYAKAFLERYCREFGANSQTTLSISFDPSLYEGKDGDPEGEEASAGEKSEKPSQEQAPAEAVPAGASETEGAREAPAQTGDEVLGVEAAKVAESAAEPAPVVPAPVVPVPAEGAKASTVFPRDFSVTVPPLPRGVTRYLGYIRTSGGNFFNFYVLAEWYKDRFGALESEAKQLFPSYGAFNLKSAGRNQIKEGAFYVIDLYPSDLMPNFDENGRVRSDFCKFVDFSRITSSKRFFSASDFGIHLVVKPAEDLDRIDFTSTMIPVSVTDSEDLEDEMKVANEFVLLEHKDCFYGPLRLKRDNRGKNYVTFSGTVNKGLVSAFRIKADKVEEVREYVRWEGAGQSVHVGVRCAKTAFMEAVSVDVWSDADLLRRLLEKSAVRAAYIRDLEKSAVRAAYIRDRLQSPEAFEDVEPDVTAGRLARARNVMRRLQYKEEVKEHVANFVLDEIRAGNDAMIDAVISRVAVGDKLIDKISAKTLVGVRVERLKAEEKTLSENIRVQEGKRDELTRKYASLEISKKGLDAELRRKALASCLLDAKKDVIEQLLKLDGMLEKRRENYRRLENLHTKLLEESKRICERTHGADGELMPESLVRRSTPGLRTMTGAVAKGSRRPSAASGPRSSGDASWPMRSSGPCRRFDATMRTRCSTSTSVGRRTSSRCSRASPARARPRSVTFWRERWVWTPSTTCCRPTNVRVFPPDASCTCRSSTAGRRSATSWATGIRSRTDSSLRIPPDGTCSARLMRRRGALRGRSIPR